MDLSVLQQKFDPYRRTAYLPRVVDHDVGPDQSKFSGIAWINEGESWPTCGFCEKPMQLLFQLNLSELPIQFEGWSEGSFVQTFYCTTGDTYCDQLGDDPFSPFGKYLCTRVLIPTACRRFDSSPVKNPIQVIGIVGWQAIDDNPTLEELETMAPGLLTEAEASLLWDLWSSWDKEYPFPAFTNDKLGGWQTGPQGVRLPSCPRCRSKMTYIFQMGDRNNLEYMFGDCGVYHLFRCDIHPHTLGFA